MAQFGGKGRQTPAVVAKAQAAQARAAGSYDKDSGWLPTPANKTFVHSLGILPKTVLVYASDNADGSSYSTDTATAVTQDSVVFTGPKTHFRVLINK